MLAITLAVAALALIGPAATAARTAAPAAPDFGPNVKIFDPSMSTAQIKSTLDAVAAQQVSN
jgi:hypothetical protein